MNTADTLSGLRGEVMRARNNVKRNRAAGKHALADKWEAEHARLLARLADTRKSAKSEGKRLADDRAARNAAAVALAGSLGGTLIPSHKGVRCAVSRLASVRAHLSEEFTHAVFDTRDASENATVDDTAHVNAVARLLAVRKGVA